jgi:hypothetical protein
VGLEIQGQCRFLRLPAYFHTGIESSESRSLSRRGEVKRTLWLARFGWLKEGKKKFERGVGRIAKAVKVIGIILIKWAVMVQTLQAEELVRMVCQLL